MHILINRNDNLGDIIYTLPLASLLKQHIPGAQVTFLVRPYAQALPQAHTAVDDVITTANFFDDKPLPRFDVFINANNCIDSAKRAKALGIPMRIGSIRRYANWWHCNRLVNIKRKQSPLHEIELNAQLLKSLLPNRYFTRQALMSFARISAKPSAFANSHLSSNQRNVIIHPASNGNGREWPVEHIIELIHLLGESEHPYRVLLTGGPNDAEVCQRISLSCPTVVNLSGKSSLEELLSLIQGAEVLIASGTGPLHVAAALGTPCIGLFPPLVAIDKARWGPDFPWCINLQHKCCEVKRCDNHDCACMIKINPKQVLGYVETLIRQHSCPSKPALTPSLAG